MKKVMTLDNTTHFNALLPVVYVSFLGFASDMDNEESTLSCVWSAVCLMACSLHLPLVLTKLKGSKVDDDGCAAGNDESSETD